MPRVVPAGVRASQVTGKTRMNTYLEVAATDVPAVNLETDPVVFGAGIGMEY